jgi:hypothetical protein
LAEQRALKENRQKQQQQRMTSTTKPNFNLHGLLLLFLIKNACTCLFVLDTEEKGLMDKLQEALTSGSAFGNLKSRNDNMSQTSLYCCSLLLFCVLAANTSSSSRRLRAYSTRQQSAMTPLIDVDKENNHYDGGGGAYPPLTFVTGCL